MPKFFVKSEQMQNNEICIHDEDAAHISVLRHKVGDRLLVSDMQGYDYLCEITAIQKSKVSLKINERKISESEPAIRTFIFQSLPKSDKMDLIVQKCVELGVYEIIPVITEHCVVKINDKIGKKVDRWQKISEAAAKQSERGVIPKVRSPVTFTESLDLLARLDEAYIAYERETANKASVAFMKSKGFNIGIFIGPEGGFSQDEIHLFQQRAFKIITLGNRILRTETASFAAVLTLLIIKEELQIEENTNFCG